MSNDRKPLYRHDPGGTHFNVVALQHTTVRDEINQSFGDHFVDATGRGFVCPVYSDEEDEEVQEDGGVSWFARNIWEYPTLLVAFFETLYLANLTREAFLDRMLVLIIHINKHQTPAVSKYHGLPYRLTSLENSDGIFWPAGGGGGANFTVVLCDLRLFRLVKETLEFLRRLERLMSGADVADTEANDLLPDLMFNDLPWTSGVFKFHFATVLHRTELVDGGDRSARDSIQEKFRATANRVNSGTAYRF